MKSLRFATVLTCLGCLASFAAAESPLGNSFTYQGKLTLNGQPANGPYDFTFLLKDSPTFGSSVGPANGLEDVAVTNGLFTVTLDFGPNAFNGSARWLDISVRPGASIGVPTTLTPRQPLNPAPYAVHALGSDQWVSDGNSIVNANSGFVGINRSTQVSSAETFGIQSSATGSNYGGMYIRTDGGSAKPFYGYSTGTKSAWTLFDGGTGNWAVYNGGTRMVITDSGNVGIDELNPTARLSVNSPLQAGGAFEIDNPGSIFTALGGITNGVGPAVAGRNSGTGLAGSFVIDNPSNNAAAVEGYTTGAGPAVYAKKVTNTSGAAIVAEAASATANALNIAQGTIRCQGAGANTNTFVFRHNTGSGGGEISYIDNPQCNNQPNAVLIVTPWWDPSVVSSRTHPPVCVGYYSGVGKWALVSTVPGVEFTENYKWNIMVIRP